MGVEGRTLSAGCMGVEGRTLISRVYGCGGKDVDQPGVWVWREGR